MAIARTGEQFTAVGSGEVELAYEAFGDAADPPVLLIMGLGSQMIFWPDELCELLADAGHHVIRFDNRDAGRSTVLDHHEPPSVRQVAAGELDAPYLLQDMAADAVGLLDALGIDRAHIVGASLGGMIAQRVAIDHPDRVLSLASIMSTTGDPEVGHPTPEAMAVLMTRAPTDHDGYIRTTLEARAVIGSQPPDRDRALDLAQRAYERGYHPDGTARQFAAVVASPDRTPELRDLSVPTVVIHGALDPLIGVSGGEATAGAIPGAELVVIENMGHDLPLWALERVAAALQQNFQRAEARAA
jgi:pimeloyl-ACP methyl ester carboxylesterase